MNYIFYLFFFSLIFTSNVQSSLSPEIIDKNLVRIKTLLPKIRTIIIEGSKVYEKAVKEVSSDQAIEADLYKQINITTSYILGIEKVLEDIEREVENAHTYFNKNKNLSALKGVLVLLSTELLIRDVYSFLLKKIHNYKRLRNILNKGDKAYDIKKDSLYKLSKKYNSISLKKKIGKGFKVFEGAKKDLPFLFKYDHGIIYLTKIIESSKNYQKGELYYNDKLKRDLKIISSNIKMESKKGKDFVVNASNDVLGAISGFSGKTILAYQWRKGTLIKNKDVIKNLKSILKPLDVANAKIRFKVSGKLIPGFWSHNGIWIGNEKELKDLGIWDHPRVKKYHEEIKRGQSFLEAVKTGVTLSSIEHFIKNLDDISVMRYKFIKPTKDKSYIADRIITSLGQIGKQYDFNFDFDYGDKIVCSDVVQLAFSKVKFPLKKKVGRFATTPDSIARAALGGKHFKVVSLYIMGEEFKGNLQERFDELTLNKK